MLIHLPMLEEENGKELALNLKIKIDNFNKIKQKVFLNNFLLKKIIKIKIL